MHKRIRQIREEIKENEDNERITKRRMTDTKNFRKWRRRRMGKR